MREGHHLVTGGDVVISFLRRNPVIPNVYTRHKNIKPISDVNVHHENHVTIFFNLGTISSDRTKCQACGKEWETTHFLGRCHKLARVSSPCELRSVMIEIGRRWIPLRTLMTSSSTFSLNPLPTLQHKLLQSQGMMSLILVQIFEGLLVKGSATAIYTSMFSFFIYFPNMIFFHGSFTKNSVQVLTTMRAKLKLWI